MSVQSRSTLKSYFITGASPSEADFGDLVDSTLLVEDIVNSFTSQSTVDPLSAAAGKILNDSINLLDARVEALENAEVTFGSSYYTKTEIDSRLSDIDAVIANLPYGVQIDNVHMQIDALNSDILGKADLSHTQAINSIIGLQDALDAKATIVELNSVRDSLIDSINAIESGGSSVDLSGINASIESLTEQIDSLESELNNKASLSHQHDVYTKAETDALVSNVSFQSHTHVSADITDLGDEIQSKTNLLVSDHSSLTNNPHGVTKGQVGLDRVENLTPSEIVSAAGIASQVDFDQIQSDLEAHKNSFNPHAITKADIGLSNVTNVNAETLLSAHLAEDNPHNIDLSFFDVYATAEADYRTQFYIDSLRYEFTPIANNDSAGAIGDFAYDQSNLYFKISDTEWGKLPFNPVYIEREATQEDVDAGRATAVGEIITVNEVVVQNVSNISINETFNITNVAGDNVFNITEEGDIHLTNTVIEGSTTVEGDTVIEGNTVINQNISSSTNHITIQNDTTIEGNAAINGIISASTGSLEFIDTREIEFWEAHKFGGSQASVPQSSKLTLTFGHDDNDTQIPDRLKLSTENYGIKEIAYLDDMPDLSGYALKSELSSSSNNQEEQDGTGGTETDIIIPGTTGGELSGYAYSPSGKYAIDYGGDETFGTGDDLDIEYWSLTASASINTGLLIDFGDPNSNPYIRYNVSSGRWESFDGTNILGFDQASELVYDIPNSTDDPYIRYDPASGEWVAYNGTSLVNVGASTTTNNTTINETNVLNQTIVQESLTIDAQTGGEEVGYAFTEGAGKYSIDYGADGVYGTADDNDSEDYFEVDASAFQNAGITVNAGLDPNPSIIYDVNANRWLLNEGGSNGDFYIGDTTQSYTKTESDARYPLATSIVDSYSKTESDGNYYTKAQSDGRYKAINSVPVELTVDLTGTDDPYIRYDSVSGEWIAFNGTSLEIIGASTTIINEGDNVTNTTILEQTIVQQSLTVDGTSGGEENGYAYAEYDNGTGTFIAVKYSINYGADNTFGTADDDDTEDYFETEESAYSNAGLTINAGLTSNPSIVYDGTTNKWLVDNGEDGSTDYGSFLLKDVDTAVSALVDSAPATLDTLNELAAALGDDPNFATTTSAALGNRVRVDTASQGLSSTQKSNARTNIGAQAAGSYASSSHNHDTRYARFDASQTLTAANKTQILTNIGAQPAGSYASASHNHDGRYYTENEVNTLLTNLQTAIEAKFYSI